MINGQTFRSAITSNLPHYCGMSMVVIVRLDRKPPATCFTSFSYWIYGRWPQKSGVTWPSSLKPLFFHMGSFACHHLPVWLQTFRKTKTQWRLPELLQTHNVTLFSHILPSERLSPLPPDIIGVAFEETNLLNYLCRLLSRTWVTGRSNYRSTSCQSSRFSWKRVEL